jgi:hypothetical protein
MTKMKFLLLALTTLLSLSTILSAQSIQGAKLYQDRQTGQLYLSPGVGRELVGEIQLTNPKAKTLNKEDNQSDQSANLPSSPNENLVAEQRVVKTAPQKAKTSWYDSVSVNGYLQLRDSFMLGHDGAEWFHPSDRSVDEDESLLLRRGRIAIKFTPRPDLEIFFQPDLSSKPGPGDYSIQLRDLYADYFPEQNRGFRFRFGQMIIPYGFVNLQSSRRRGPLERPEALNSGAEGERDLGVFFMYSPVEAQKRFSELTKSWYKGSGDHGVWSLGLYNGQGLNRSDRNGEPHIAARWSYPYLVANKYFLEPSISTFLGRYVPTTMPLELTDQTTVTPEFADDGIVDYRSAVGLVLHPNPLGFEFEWNGGKGPELTEDLARIESRSLQGGYFLLNYKTDLLTKTVIPFIRWHLYEGGRKFAVNSPRVKVNELNLGSEVFLNDLLKITTEYSYVWRRTNSAVFPYQDLTDGHRLALQLQANY